MYLCQKVWLIQSILIDYTIKDWHDLCAQRHERAIKILCNPLESILYQARELQVAQAVGHKAEQEVDNVEGRIQSNCVVLSKDSVQRLTHDNQRLNGFVRAVFESFGKKGGDGVDDLGLVFEGIFVRKD